MFKAELSAGEQKHDVKMELSFKCGSKYEQSSSRAAAVSTTNVHNDEYFTNTPRITTIKA